MLTIPILNGYCNGAVVNPTVGIATPITITATQARKRLFLCQSLAYLNYGGLSGATERLAGFCSGRLLQPCSARHQLEIATSTVVIKITTTERLPSWSMMIIAYT
ncbi:hypothetical protein KKI93_07805 [Xenorhabdus bovienii]|uniref:hypothetical protein n=1 Tax=Xenorhabdus bovienii TaxID=40576 RepID=UPI0023B33E99|nr:hypothetical protein [Xenorhabdus bovienii]MDE9543484.1 hypothetical protein [Xenorhabdus bovienii]MDE9563973.1 hypothetical protein [Xenorhabdus bovienii]